MLILKRSFSIKVLILSSCTLRQILKIKRRITYKNNVFVNINLDS